MTDPGLEQPRAKRLCDQLLAVLDASDVSREVKADVLVWLADRYYAEIGFPCADCGVDVADIDEEFAVTDPVWKAAGMDPLGGYLCVECLERRLGRRLTSADFRALIINDPEQWPCSPRLLERLRS